jgi:hypothetical protein
MSDAELIGLVAGIFVLVLVSFFTAVGSTEKVETPRQATVNTQSNGSNVSKDEQIGRKEIKNLTVIELQKIGSIVFPYFDWKTLRRVGSLLRFKGEIREVVESLNYLLLEKYKKELISRYKFHTSVAEAEAIRDLVTFGLDHFFNESEIKAAIAEKKPQKTIGKPAEDSYTEEIKKVSEADRLLSVLPIKAFDNVTYSKLKLSDIALGSVISPDQAKSIIRELEPVWTSIRTEEQFTEALYRSAEDCFESVNANLKVQFDQINVPFRRHNRKIQNLARLFLTRQLIDLILLHEKTITNPLNAEMRHALVRIGLKSADKPVRRSVKVSEQKAKVSVKTKNSKVSAKESVVKEDVLISAQVAAKVVKHYDYDSLEEVLPVLTEPADFASALDSLHKKLFPMYKQELEKALKEEGLKVESLTKHLNQCKKFGKKLILDAALVKKHMAGFSPADDEVSLDSDRKTDPKTKGRLIKKAKKWDELKDKI